MTSNSDKFVTDSFIHHVIPTPKRSSQQPQQPSQSPHSTGHAYFPAAPNPPDSGRGLPPPTNLFGGSAQLPSTSGFQPQDRPSYATGYPHYVSHNAGYGPNGAQHYQHGYQQRQMPETYQSRPPHASQPLDIAHNNRPAPSQKPEYSHSPPSPRTKPFFVLPPPSALAAGVPHISPPHAQERHASGESQGYLPAFSQQHPSISLPPLSLSDQRPMMSEPVYGKAYEQRQPQSAPQPMVDPSRAMRADPSRVPYPMQAPQPYNQNQAEYFPTNGKREHHHHHHHHDQRVSHGDDDRINGHYASNHAKREREPEAPHKSKVHQGHEHAPSRKRSRGSNVLPPSGRAKKITTPPPNILATSPPQTPPATTTVLKYEIDPSRKPSLRVEPTSSQLARQADKITPPPPHPQVNTHTHDHAQALASLVHYDPANHANHTLASVQVPPATTSANYTTTPPATPSIAPNLSRRRSSCSSQSSTSSSDPSSASSMSSTGQHMHACDECGKSYKHATCLTKHKWEHSSDWKEVEMLDLNKHQQVQVMEAAQILIEIASMRVNVVN
ncbi:hypothetical protein BC938DRAFT_476685 [Jimgerdemannia flammicorona]|uniref:C2H2-type domain-containing protein n=1 Tax=Jimgerdemannia flammicorona TaxID=994334 RepID=A0A433PF66_9FUNG|nr:hypothetical protein BC938DRAFT_476685 [Jimgerdemannia flammicorona]